MDAQGLALRVSSQPVGHLHIEEEGVHEDEGPDVYSVLADNGVAAKNGSQVHEAHSTQTQRNAMQLNIKTPTSLRAFTLLAILTLSTNSAIAGLTPPAYDPGFWNASGRVSYNNCYNYATNEATNTFAQPGRAYFGYNPITANNLTCTEVRSFAALDGTLQEYNGKDTFLFAGYTASAQCDSDRPARMALVVAPGYDYHWYRVDRDTGDRWSHKRGGTYAKNVDESGQAIYSIEAANRGPYTQVCGYFCGYSSSTAQDTGAVTIN